LDWEGCWTKIEVGKDNMSVRFREKVRGTYVIVYLLSKLLLPVPPPKQFERMPPTRWMMNYMKLERNWLKSGADAKKQTSALALSS
jgi:hypothetical protein